jgi:hypothetical protein
MKEIVMKHKIAVMAGLALVVLIGAGVLYSQQKVHPSAAQQEKIAALKELRDSGVITAQEYDSKVQALQASSPAVPASPASGASQPAHFAKISSSMRRVEATDPQYQITAFTMEVPADWKFNGTIVRPPGCHGHGASIKYTAQSADGLSAVVVLPGVAWNWASSETAQKYMAQNCPAIDIDTAASFLVNIAVPNIHPDAKIVAVLPLLPEGQASLKDQLAKEIQQNASLGNFKQVNPKWTLEGANVRVQYTRDGHPVEEMISAVIHCNEQTMPAMFKEPAYQRRSCFSRGTVISRAPQGHLDEMMALKLNAKFASSMQPNPEWQNRIAADQQAAFQQAMDANNRQAAANLEHFKQQGEQRLAAGKAFQDRQADSFNRAMTADQQKQAAIDASAHATALHSLDQQEFRNPNTGQIIQASNQYNHQWISSDGSTLIQTNDHNLDPNGQVYPVSQSWTELVVK